MDIITQILALYAAIPSEIKMAIVIAIIGSGATQIVKKRGFIHSRWIEVFGSVITVLPSLWLWPSSSMTDRVWAGIFIGIATVLFYKPVIRFMYKRWPELEDKVSARPRLKLTEDGQLGIKEDENSKTRVLTKEEIELYRDTTVPRKED